MQWTLLQVPLVIDAHVSSTTVMPLQIPMHISEESHKSFWALS